MLSSRIGILGGGQLGLMLLQAAVDWNLDIHVLDPDAEAPCRKIAPHFTQGSLQDFDTVYNFGKDLDVITIEIEKVNVQALEALEKEGKKVYPQPSVIRQIQDKRIQKQFYAEKQLPTAEFILTENRQDVANYISFLPAFHKLGKDGYDGRGVQRLTSAADLDKAFDKPGLLEKAVPFEKELAVIVARNANGEVATFPTVEMVFHPEANLVEYLFAPAEISGEVNAKAQEIARKTAEAFQIVGLLAVELFLTPEGEVLINEVAPRPHNSGHHTIRANATSQYEQHWRAILNLPLGSTHAYGPSAMVNLLGEDGYEGPAVYEGMEKLLATPQVFPFLYWKAITKPFRKMGHITIMDADIASLKAKADFVKNNIKVISHKTK
ncbi:5-(carboxyamino)imidazole ribonucleotide synthase [Dyadobacter sp. BE34]|uniref:N5-carboxyaminoimidazole ribonucleotide synthase n=1 Tax=Dyadobacter fermentans TaxID=94254 RepID=A0ABU1R7D5_9BACT|nr:MULTISPECIES: 5-(carboxyamino)imidazole ribonucleotide synthase [Dyadobacter]MDR6809117.1 5-(carboxyamino)imidazole ribonucleotide synthase [Dyadobacter fermentans]MDR7046860.1 5-(carboxyamino)imidazole ribonucleotide synthase [Dyadobacter sp. BE242]MDR7201174.1 5-(carboxyamino)imidazole ribonucleotide synthase [Dyadobacter sp. BE34]MDR7219134.1 5-(carboxyamino)imidazole ribonucleotide synthase [Dyadobacter sp. BE31]MDR7264656.1 5-(carboxyamino)imidazole ribonucleotide synthase [Dyadobacter